jgi:hypothetical protein
MFKVCIVEGFLGHIGRHTGIYCRIMSVLLSEIDYVICLSLKIGTEGAKNHAPAFILWQMDTYKE